MACSSRSQPPGSGPGTTYTAGPLIGPYPLPHHMGSPIVAEYGSASTLTWLTVGSLTVNRTSLPGRASKVTVVDDEITIARSTSVAAFLPGSHTQAAAI